MLTMQHESCLLTNMKNVADIIEALGGNAVVARNLDVPPSTVSEIKRRGVLPVKYFRSVIDLAKEKGVDGVTAEFLVDLHASVAASP